MALAGEVIGHFGIAGDGTDGDPDPHRARAPRRHLGSHRARLVKFVTP
ncbi:MAG: hypothetical protein R2699_08600 [Acidimicrobiales bacterium]